MTVPVPPSPRPCIRERPSAEIHYPSSDGKPMAENDAQRQVMIYGFEVLEVRYVHDPNVYVTTDLLMYYEEGNPKAAVAPDVFVAFGVEKRARESYMVWKEGKVPDFVLEVTAPGTWQDDEGWKRELYARLGVKEYWQFDPTGELLDVPLKGGRLRDGEYEPIAVEEAEDGERSGDCAVLGLGIRSQDREIRFRDPKTGLDLLDRRAMHLARLAEAQAEREANARWLEENARRRAAELKIERESEARRKAEARIAELEALLRDRSE